MLLCRKHMQRNYSLSHHQSGNYKLLLFLLLCCSEGRFLRISPNRERVADQKWQSRGQNYRAASDTGTTTSWKINHYSKVERPTSNNLLSHKRLLEDSNGADITSVIIVKAATEAPSQKPSDQAPVQQPSFTISSDIPSLVPSEETTYSLLSSSPSFGSFSFVPLSAEPSMESISVEPSISPIPSEMLSDMPSSNFISDREDFSSSLSVIDWSSSSVPTQVASQVASGSDYPTALPTLGLSASPTLLPSILPTVFPSDSPSETPTLSPTELPSDMPSDFPTFAPTEQPSHAPSSAPSSVPTLECHDDPLYRSPINDFVCLDHIGTPCLQWRYLGLTLDDLENLISSCPVSCEIDCGTLTRFDISVSYQISSVPGLLDAVTVDDLNSLTQDFVSDFLRTNLPSHEFFIDSVELLSQSILSKGFKHTLAKKKPSYSDKGGSGQRHAPNRQLTMEVVNLWITMAIRGFAFNYPLENTTRSIVAGIDSLGYSNAIQNSGNANLADAYAFSAEKKEDESVAPISESSKEDDNSTSAAIIVVVIFLCLGACAVCIFLYYRRLRTGSACCRFRRQRKILHVESDLQSPVSHNNVASPVGSMFSFEDSATAGTNGLMRFIGSFNRSKGSTTPGSSADHSAQFTEEETDCVVNQELDYHNRQENESNEDASADSEPHPLAGLIPPMVVYDHIDEDEEENRTGHKKVCSKPRAPSLVPSKRVDASSEFIATIGNRQRPSAPHELEEYFSETSNFVCDPEAVTWTRLEATRPSPIGIDLDTDGDDVSVASTPARIKIEQSETESLRRTKSLDDFSVQLESVVSDILLSTRVNYAANVSPMDEPAVVRAAESPKIGQPLFEPVDENVESSGRKRHTTNNSDESALYTWTRNTTGLSAPSEMPTLRKSSSVKSLASVQDRVQGPRASFWNRSPIAKGVKDAIWSTKHRVGTPTRFDAAWKRQTGVSTPARTASASRAISTLNRVESSATRRTSIQMQHPPTPTRTNSPIKRGPAVAPPTRPDSSTAIRRSSTPTRLENHVRRIPTPTKIELARRKSASPNGISGNLSSEDSNSESWHSSKSRSGSVSTGQGSTDEDEVHFEFRAARIGKLGLVINSSPETGPFVEQVKDYSTLFGCVLAGDKIVEVDGLETSRMTIKEVTKRLAGKYGIRPTSSEVRIKVARARETRPNDDDRESDGSGVLSFASAHHRLNSRELPEPLIDRSSLTSISEHHLSFHSLSNHSKSGEEV